MQRIVNDMAIPLAVMVLLGTIGTAGGTSPARPNFILLMSDDQGWEDTGYARHPFLDTPHLDAMASAGLRLDRFYAACPKCSPTRASVMTGRHPHRFDFFNGINFPARERTLGQVLSEAGYTTGHFGKWHLGKMDVDDDTFPARVGFDTCRSRENQFGVDPVLVDENGQEQRFSGDGSVVIVEECLEFAAASSRSEQPFCAVVWFASPHAPHTPLPEDRKPYLRRPNSGYYGEIAGIDRAIGRLRAGLREIEIAADTLLWYCSDNGRATPWDGSPLRGGKTTCWEGGLRVPCLIEWPNRIEPGSRSDLPASTIDILPTLAAIAGVSDLKARGPLDGINLLPLFDGDWKTRPEPVPFSWYGPAGVIDGRYKICRGHPDPKQWKKDRDSWYLFDLVTDPGETVNLAEEHPELLAKMQEQFHTWIQSAEADPGRR